MQSPNPVLLKAFCKSQCFPNLQNTQKKNINVAQTLNFHHQAIREGSMSKKVVKKQKLIKGTFYYAFKKTQSDGKTFLSCKFIKFCKFYTSNLKLCDHTSNNIFFFWNTDFIIVVLLIFKIVWWKQSEEEWWTGKSSLAESDWRSATKLQSYKLSEL